jgi:hypothetical protein
MQLGVGDRHGREFVRLEAAANRQETDQRHGLRLLNESLQVSGYAPKCGKASAAFPYCFFALLLIAGRPRLNQTSLFFKYSYQKSIIGKLKQIGFKQLSFFRH